jgi:hypothetical protein
VEVKLNVIKLFIAKKLVFLLNVLLLHVTSHLLKTKKKDLTSGKIVKYMERWGTTLPLVALGCNHRPPPDRWPAWRRRAASEPESPEESGCNAEAS